MFKYIVLASLLGLAKPSLAAVTIQFNPLEHFTDLSLSGSNTPNIKPICSNNLRRFLMRSPSTICRRITRLRLR